MARTKNIDESLIYCICPKCGARREKIKGTYTIIKRGKERNGIARFLCLKCEKWFNEETGNSMSWTGRV